MEPMVGIEATVVELARLMVRAAHRRQRDESLSYVTQINEIVGRAEPETRQRLKDVASWAEAEELKAHGIGTGGDPAVPAATQPPPRDTSFEDAVRHVGGAIFPGDVVTRTPSRFGRREPRFARFG